jgi:tetratricopeptide (TPR) repeat protein
MKRSTTLFLALLLFPLARCSARNAAAQNAQTAPATGSAAQLTLTTQSARAKELFGQAIVESGNYRLDECLKDLRAAVKEDPDFAAGWALLSYYATDSGESAKALQQANKTAGRASLAEQVLVQWISSLKSNYQLGAIASLNDLTAAAPGDKYVLYLAGRWFFDQGKTERAANLFEKVLAIDPNFTPALNRLGYAYAALDQLPKALETMQRYVAAMPDDPNPEDSFGDILFKAGRFDEAQAHFEAALKKDPKFGPSQHELGDVYAMKGEYEKAREAYRKAAAVAANPRRSIEYRSSIGLTYVREGNLGQADKEYGALAVEAKAAGFHDLEAALQLTMARYQTDDDAALKHLAAAEEAVRGDEHMAASQRDELMAAIRRWRGMRSMHAGNTGMTEVCLRLLQDKWGESDNEAVGSEYHALEGAWLANQKKYAEAAAQLEEAEDVFSLALLSQVKLAMGDAAGAAAAKKELLARHEWTIEGVLVIEPARK